MGWVFVWSAILTKHPDLTKGGTLLAGLAIDDWLKTVSSEAELKEIIF